MSVPAQGDGQAHGGALAADLLRDPGATIGSVARKVGYGTPFALSTAFKRSRGVSPGQYRVHAE